MAAQAGLSGHFEYAADVRLPRKFTQGIPHRRMQLQSPVRPLKQRIFHRLKLFYRGARFPDAAAQFAGQRTPDQIERYTFVAKRVGWGVKEGSRRTRPKDHTHRRFERAGIDYAE